MSGRTIGNFILMTVIYVVVFWVFMAIHGARAENVVPYQAEIDFGTGPVKIKEVTLDGSGRIVSARDLDGNLYTRNEAWMHGAPARIPQTFVFYATPKGQLPACNSAEVVTNLARMANKTLNWPNPTTIGATRDGKNICTNGRLPFTVEWLSDGRYWVHF